MKIKYDQLKSNRCADLFERNRRVLCFQTNNALPQLCNISRVSAETSFYCAQCIFALLCTVKKYYFQT